MILVLLFSFNAKAQETIRFDWAGADSMQATVFHALWAQTDKRLPSSIGLSIKSVRNGVSITVSDGKNSISVMWNSHADKFSMTLDFEKWISDWSKTEAAPTTRPTSVQGILYKALLDYSRQDSDASGLSIEEHGNRIVLQDAEHRVVLEQEDYGLISAKYKMGYFPNDPSAVSSGPSLARTCERVRVIMSAKVDVDYLRSDLVDALDRDVLLKSTETFLKSEAFSEFLARTIDAHLAYQELNELTVDRDSTAFRVMCEMMRRGRSADLLERLPNLVRALVNEGFRTVRK